MALAKTKARSKDSTRHRPSVATAVSRGAPDKTTDSFVFRRRAEPGTPGITKKPAHEKTRLATFSLTPEDLRYVEKATYQVIQALETGVSKSHTVRLAMRAFASMSVEELRRLLSRTSMLT